MTVYNIDKNTNIPDIAALIFIKYNDANSLNKLLFLMRAQYNFSSKFVTTDFDGALIKSLKECELFLTTPTIIPCLFHYTQTLIKKLKYY